ncbi:glycosyltransferase family 90 protein [Collybiopsis luxurians FD-317 M1]|nr:glycosyltransferase family 90 protein [Collybiopsis luxurians FD-317 M1]
MKARTVGGPRFIIRRRFFAKYVLALILLLAVAHTSFHAGYAHNYSNFSLSSRLSLSLPLLSISLSAVHLLSKSYILTKQSAPKADTTHDMWSTHPITRLMSLAEDRFRFKLDKQSKTLEAAVAEYQRRYSMPPPKGFDKWWEFAKKYGVVMVDEYDGMMRDLKPFYHLGGGGQELRKRIAEVASLPSIDLVRIKGGAPSTISVQADGYVDTEVSARAKGLKSMLGKFVEELPDMDFPVNAKAEGRVIVPWEKRKIQYNSTTDNTTNPFVSFKPDWKGEGNVWDAWRRTCPPESRARKLFGSLRSGMVPKDQSSTHPILDNFRKLSDPSNPFNSFNPYDPSKADRIGLSATNQAKSGLSSPQFTFSPFTPYHDLSFCDQPHLHYMQGHFFSDWRTVGDLYPVMSPARARGFADIKIPSHYYYGSTSRYTYGWDPARKEVHEVDQDEVPWGRGKIGSQDSEEATVSHRVNESVHKIDKIFWRGATTGGGSEPPGFAGMYQRHRAVRNLGRWSKEGSVEVYVPKAPTVSTSNFSWRSSLAKLRRRFSLKSQLMSNLDDSGSNSLGEQADLHGGLRHFSIPYSIMNKVIMDLAFMKATNPAQYPGGMEKLVLDHRFAEGIPLGGHWKYKYLLDLDGMSYSGRFMAFLASDSVPVKSTVYEEFFGEWIEPWLHYIPLSAGYEEIYNIYTYFSGIPGEVVEHLYKNSTSAGSETVKEWKITGIPGAPDGDARLRRIAHAGKQWKKTIGRTIDMEAYVYRLALEWARLCANNREAMSMAI